MIKFYNDGDRVTAALAGDIDHCAARELRAELDEMIEHTRPKLLIIDMENVGFMDSSGVGLILGRRKALSEVGGELLIKNAGPQILRILSLSGLEKIIVHTPRAAIKT